MREYYEQKKIIAAKSAPNEFLQLYFHNISEDSIEEDVENSSDSIDFDSDVESDPDSNKLHEVSFRLNESDPCSCLRMQRVGTNGNK